MFGDRTGTTGVLKTGQDRDACVDRYRMLFDLESDAILLVDAASGRVLEGNAAASQLYGYPPDQLRSLTMSELATEPDAWPIVDPARQPCDTVFTLPLRFHRRHDGGVVPTEITGRTFLERGRCVHLLAIRDVTLRWQAERALHESEERLRTILDHAPQAIYVRVDDQFVYVNAEAVRLFGATSVLDLLGMSVLDRIAPDKRDCVIERMRIVSEDRQAVPPFDHVFLRLDGTQVPVEVSATPISYLNKPASLVFARDNSQRRRLEAQLAQARQLDSIGRLADGVAHDFNNMLNVIGGYTELTLSRLRHDDPLRIQLQEVKRASERAADITRQLLVFSNNQQGEPRLIDMHQHLRGAEAMMRRVLGEAATLRLQLAQGPAVVRVDPARLDQALVNLLSNARDATIGIGSVRVETRIVTFDAGASTRYSTFEAGPYVELAVIDDGCGMDVRTQEHVFEPFFTTKATHRGAGLGLAVVYGVARQYRGGVDVASEPGRGTTVRVFLPRHGTAVLPGHPGPALKPPGTGGHEVLLVVEDEDQVRRLVVAALERGGYTILQAGTPEAALRLVRETSGVIDLLVTDVIMPGMNGAELQRELLAIRPGLRTLFMSGYAANILGEHGIVDDGAHFIQKPFSVVELTRKVRDLLDRPA